jgi:hypothetical protein
MPRNRTGFVISALVMTLIAAVAHPAGAGTIDVGGTVTFGPPFTPGVLDLVGDRGFTAHGLFGLFGQIQTACMACLPGDPIRLSTALFTPDLFNGVVTLDGTTYNVGGELASAAEPDLRLQLGAGGLFAPPLNVAPIVALTTSAGVSGSFRHSGTLVLAGVLEEFDATATATIVLQRSNNCFPPITDCWNSEGVTFDLTPTPEPATLVLFGTTMAGLGLAAWRKLRDT